MRYKLAAFLISVTLASLAGSLYAFFFNFLAPEMVGTSRSLELVAMLIIGGESTLVGGLFGAPLLTLLPTIFAAARDLQDLCLRRAAGLEFPLSAAGFLRRVDPDPDAARATARCYADEGERDQDGGAGIMTAIDPKPARLKARS